MPSSAYTRNFACYGAGGRMIHNAEYANPESRHWQETADSFKHLLGLAIGEAAYLEWAELTWPGASIEACTWKQIARANEAAYRAASAGEHSPAHLSEIAKEMFS